MIAAFFRKINYRRYRPLRVILIIVGLLLTLSLPLVFWFNHQSVAAQDAPPLSPLPQLNPSSVPESNDLSYYISTSQQLLNKARTLANNNNQQTNADKEKIVQIINAALDLANQGIVYYSTDDRAYAHRASLYQALIPFVPESIKNAITDLRVATGLNEHNPEYFLRLAGLYTNLNDYQNASIYYYNAYQLSPTNVQTLYLLADSLEKSGNLNQAKDYFAKLLALLPQDDNSLSTISTHLTSLQSTPNIPVAQATPIDLLGTQELPLQQASLLASKVIIAGPNDENVTQTSSETSNNTTNSEEEIPIGQLEVKISAAIKAEQQIIIIPLVDTQNRILSVIARKNDEWFKVGVDNPADFTIKFKWLIINQ